MKIEYAVMRTILGVSEEVSRESSEEKALRVIEEELRGIDDMLGVFQIPDFFIRKIYTQSLTNREI